MKKLYIVSFCEGTSKVGVSSNPGKRIKSIRTGAGLLEPIDFRVIEHPRAEDIEQIFLTKYAAQTTSGEWVSMPFSCVNEAVDKIADDLEASHSYSHLDADWRVLLDGFLDSQYVDLGLILKEFNLKRVADGQPKVQMQAFLGSKGVASYIEAASLEWGIPPGNMLVKPGGIRPGAKTLAHIAVAVYLAEQCSPRFKAKVHKAVIEQRSNLYEILGGTEFVQLNAAIDEHLPGRDGKSNKGVFIQVAKRLRSKVLGDAAVAGDWNRATVGQTHWRYEIENKLTDMLRLGLVKDYEHLKQLIDKL